ncbi:MAG: hypothetical protein IJW49_08290 [Clostridia bacterium]|nr:hypothetical protein [Clostridia bacterium]
MPIWILIVGGVIGIALILFGSHESNVTEPIEDTVPVPETDTVRYQEYLETRIEELCASMGLGEVSAIVTLEGSFREIYATEWQGENEEYVIVGSGSSAQALLLSRQAPEIMGIGVVCRTSLSPIRSNELVSLLSATFHTPTNRIYITQGA